jgi:hypothetical protein
MDIHELNYLEEVFIEILDFDLNVKEEEFESYKQAMDQYF